MDNLNTIWQMLRKTHRATGTSRRGTKTQKQKSMGPGERNLRRSCRLRARKVFMIAMTSKLRSEGGAGASQEGVDGKEVLGSRSMIQGEE